jgi:hypothetical protein
MISDSDHPSVLVQPVAIDEARAGGGGGCTQPLRFWMFAHSSLRPTVRWKVPGVSGSVAK